MRMKANAPARLSPPLVLGCLLGSQDGRIINISNSFEVKAVPDTNGALEVDQQYLTRKQDQCESSGRRWGTSVWSYTAFDVGAQQGEGKGSGAVMEDRKPLIHQVYPMIVGEGGCFGVSGVPSRRPIGTLGTMGGRQ